MNKLVDVKLPIELLNTETIKEMKEHHTIYFNFYDRIRIFLIMNITFATKACCCKKEKARQENLNRII